MRRGPTAAEKLNSKKKTGLICSASHVRLRPARAPPKHSVQKKGIQFSRRPMESHVRRRPARAAAEKLNSKKKELNFFGVPFAARAGPGRRRRKIKFKKIKFKKKSLIFSAPHVRRRPSRVTIAKLSSKKKNFVFPASDLVLGAECGQAFFYEFFLIRKT